MSADYDCDSEMSSVAARLHAAGATWLEIEHAFALAAEKARRAYERETVRKRRVEE